MCRWMAPHFHEWSDYNGVAFSRELLEWVRALSDFWGYIRQFFIFTVSKRTRMFVRGTQREYSSKPLKHSTVKCILVFKR